MSTKIYPNGTAEFTVASGEKVAVSANKGDAKVYQIVGYPNHPDTKDLLTELTSGEYISSAFSADTTVIIEAGPDGALYSTGASPITSDPVDYNVSRGTVADAGTLTDAQHQEQVIYQDASGGAVTCTTRTAAQLVVAFPDLAIGDAVHLYHASNHGTNTSTISGGTGVTLVGSGAVINTGGQYLLIRTAAATYDLVRVG